MQNITILKKNKDMVTRKIADETILLPIYRTSKEINCIYTLNKPASIVWDMIDGKTTVGEIKDKVLNNGFDLTGKAQSGKGTKAQRGKGKREEGTKAQSGKEWKAEREREDEKQSLKVQKEEVDSQLKVFFGELKEIKAVVREKAQSGKGTKSKSASRDSIHVSQITKKGRRMKFRPEITRVKLNPEQAVLTCDCYKSHSQLGPGLGLKVDGNLRFGFHDPTSTIHACDSSRVVHPQYFQAGGGDDPCTGGFMNTDQGNTSS